MNGPQIEAYIINGMQAMRAAKDSRALAALSYHLRGELQRQFSGFDEIDDPPALAERTVRRMVLTAFRVPLRAGGP